MTSPYEIKKEICEIGRRIYNNGFVAANDGNISVKVNDNEFYCTPTGVSKGFMTPDMIIRIDGTGKKIEGNLNPSSEIKMHLRVYRERPDVNAVVHAHPPTATAFTVAGLPMDKYILPEAVLVLGDVPDLRLRHPVHRGDPGFPHAVHPESRRLPAEESWRPDGRQHADQGVLRHGRGGIQREDQCDCLSARRIEEIPCDDLIKLMSCARSSRCGPSSGLQEMPEPRHRKLQVQGQPAGQLCSADGGAAAAANSDPGCRK